MRLTRRRERRLPFCSHKTPNQDQRRRKTLYQQKTSKSPLPNDFSTRSEGYRSWPLHTHNPYLKALRCARKSRCWESPVSYSPGLRDGIAQGTAVAFGGYRGSGPPCVRAL